jgi:hypothetical protein
VLGVQAENLSRTAVRTSRSEIRRIIGQQLGAYYGPTEPIPDRLTEVLRPFLLRIDQCESAQKQRSDQG